MGVRSSGAMTYRCEEHGTVHDDMTKKYGVASLTILSRSAETLGRPELLVCLRPTRTTIRNAKRSGNGRVYFCFFFFIYFFSQP